VRGRKKGGGFLRRKANRYLKRTGFAQAQKRKMAEGKAQIRALAGEWSFQVAVRENEKIKRRCLKPKTTWGSKQKVDKNLSKKG